MARRPPGGGNGGGGQPQASSVLANIQSEDGFARPGAGFAVGLRGRLQQITAARKPVPRTLSR
eukprot:8659369-Pyramimonas_sp.AAC.1